MRIVICLLTLECIDDIMYAYKHVTGHLTRQIITQIHSWPVQTITTSIQINRIHEFVLSLTSSQLVISIINLIIIHSPVIVQTKPKHKHAIMVS